MTYARTHWMGASIKVYIRMECTAAFSLISNEANSATKLKLHPLVDKIRVTVKTTEINLKLAQSFSKQDIYQIIIAIR